MTSEAERKELRPLCEDIRTRVAPILKDGIGYRSDLVGMLGCAYLAGVMDAKRFLESVEEGA